MQPPQRLPAPHPDAICWGSQAPAAMGACLACHRVNGTNLNVAPVGLEQSPGTEDAPGSAKTAGPNLSLFGCRTYIGAGVLENTPENLAKWLRDPGAVKPGNYMATVIKNGTLNEQQITEIVGYLESLKPEGGCPAITGEVLPDNVASPAANEAAVNEAMTAAQNAQTTAVAAQPTQPTQSPAQPTQAGQASPSGPIEVSLEDIKFNPAEITIPANTDVTINLVNKGVTAHTFDIDALNIHSGEMQPGATASVTINAAAGDYQYYCAVPGHKEAGMIGTLRVAAGGAAPPSQPGAQPTQAPAGGQAGPVDVSLEDIKFNPTEITIPANTDVTINLVNKGVTAHSFDIDNLNVHSGEVQAGATATVTINAPPGEYEYYCAVPGHKEAGMIGKLIVQ